MAKTSAIVTLLDGDGKAIQKTITDVNPEVTNQVLVEFAKKINATSQNAYSSTVRVDKTNCDTETSKVDTRPVPTLTLEKTSDTLDNVKTALNADDSGVYEVEITYNGTAIPYVITSYDEAGAVISGSVFKDNIYCRLVITGGNPELITSTTFTIGTLENDDFKAAVPVTFEITD